MFVSEWTRSMPHVEFKICLEYMLASSFGPRTPLFLKRVIFPVVDVLPIVIFIFILQEDKNISYHCHMYLWMLECALLAELEVTLVATSAVNQKVFIYDEDFVDSFL